MPELLFLHIGTEKTGTTAIQRFLHQHSQYLLTQGFSLLSHFGQYEHRRFTLLFYDDDQYDDLTFTEGLDALSIDDRRETVRRWVCEFDKELNSGIADNLIISSEHIHSRLLHRSSCMTRLAAFIAKRFNSISVIIYIRDPFEAALSLWSTAVINGAPLMSLPPPSDFYWRRLCSHKNTIQLLEKWFPGRFSVRLYNPSEWPDGNIVYDLASAIGLDLQSLSLPFRTRANESISWLAIRMLAIMNQRGITPTRDIIARLRTEYAHCGPPTASRSMRLAYHEAFKESNEWTLKSYFPDRQVLFLS